VTLSDGVFSRVRPTEAWKTAAVKLSSPEAFQVDEVFYVTSKNVSAP
jgi:hypothetical protein